MTPTKTKKRGNLIHQHDWCANGPDKAECGCGARASTNILTPEASAVIEAAIQWARIRVLYTNIEQYNLSRAVENYLNTQKRDK